MATDTPATPAQTPAQDAAAPKKKSLGDAYLWMLILALLFLMLGCGMLLLEWSSYWADSWFQLKPANK